MSRAFWTIAPGRGELRAEPINPIARDDAVLIRARAGGISRGTESLVIHGRVPPSQYAAMRAPLMAGEFPFPVKYGYSVVGLDPAGGRVFVLHPHQDIFYAPRAMCIRVPDSVPTPRATLAANMETAINIIWDAGPLPGERMLVIGAGVVGLLVASLLARTPGAAVTLVDINPRRAEQAARIGVRFAGADAAPADQELIVHCSGSEAGLRLALRSAAMEGRIIEASWFGDAMPALPLGENFHARRLRLIASQVGQVAPAMRGRRTHGERLALALDLLSDAAYDTLLEPPTAFEALPAQMPRLLTGGLCHVIDYGTTPCTA